MGPLLALVALATVPALSAGYVAGLEVTPTRVATESSTTLLVYDPAGRFFPSPNASCQVRANGTTFYSEDLEVRAPNQLFL